MCPIIAIVIKLGIGITNTVGFEKSVRKLFKCLPGGKVELIFIECPALQNKYLCSPKDLH